MPATMVHKCFLSPCTVELEFTLTGTGEDEDGNMTMSFEATMDSQEHLESHTPPETPPRPGECIQRELAGRQWTQADLAEVMGRPLQMVNEVISGKKQITRVTAMQLGAALQTTAEHWLGMQDAYGLWLLGQDSAHRARLRAIKMRARERREAQNSL